MLNYNSVNNDLKVSFVRVKILHSISNVQLPVFYSIIHIFHDTSISTGPDRNCIRRSSLRSQLLFMHAKHYGGQEIERLTNTQS